ncbi:MAG: hypothetical protein OXE77_03595 [Flavobacteriaceae bacterium]|nr:hypothetical protein [Flavobacteriaceae bacterium]MCY4266399.1 hypothetical protein [Flavobacteriaceae bacterium]
MKKPLIAIVFILVLFLNSSSRTIQFNIFNDPYVDKLSLIELLEKDIEQQKQMRKEMLKS